MSSQDDPEARIRELEQADHGAVELGAGHYGGGSANPTASLPPPVYTDPYATTPYGAPPFGVAYPPPPRKGPSAGWVLGLVAVIVVMSVGVIGVIMWSVMANQGGGATRPGGGSAEKPFAPTFDPPTVVPRIPGDDEDEVITAPAGAPLSVSGIDEVRTVACDDNIVSVSGIDNTVTITGHCASVTVSGVDNSVSIDSADKIGASGFENQITYFSGDPQIDNFGASNTVERG